MGGVKPFSFNNSTGIFGNESSNFLADEGHEHGRNASENDDGNSVDSLFGGRYLDELEKRAGQWRISKRRYILDLSYQLPNGLEDLVKSGFNLPVLQIQQSGHPDYREL